MNKWKITAVFLIIIFIWLIAMPLLKRWQTNSGQVQYEHNLKIIFTLISKYAEQNGKYPNVNNWCDELVKSMNLREDLLFCGSAGDPLYYNTTDPNTVPNYGGGKILLNEEIKANGQKIYFYQFRWSYYALNSIVEPNSADDVVLLFSTKGGWNQFGGPGIFSIDNFKEIGRVGGYVLFNNGDVIFVKQNEISRLNWGKSTKSN